MSPQRRRGWPSTSKTRSLRNRGGVPAVRAHRQGGAGGRAPGFAGGQGNAGDGRLGQAGDVMVGRIDRGVAIGAQTRKADGANPRSRQTGANMSGAGATGMISPGGQSVDKRPTAVAK